MNETYVKLINAVLPDSLIEVVASKTGVEKNKVELCAAEVIARVFGTGDDLKKQTIIAKLNKTTDGESIKSIILKINSKHGIEAGEIAKVLQQVLPVMKSRINSLDNSYFDPDEIPFAEASVEDVFKNIEKKVEEQAPVKEKIRKPLFKKKEKVKKEVKEEVVETKETTLTEKICMWAVLIAFVGLVATVVVLTIIAKTSA